MKRFAITLLAFVIILGFWAAPVLADSKVSALTAKTTEPDPADDLLYYIDMSETVAASRSKKISPQVFKRDRTVWVKSWSQFDTLGTVDGGDSVYQVNPDNGTIYMVDTSAIYLAGVTFDPITGITIMLPQSVSGVSNQEITIRKADSGITPIQIWAYSADGVTFQRIWRDTSGVTGIATDISDMDTGGDVRTYVMCPDPESSVSAWPVSNTIQ